MSKHFKIFSLQKSALYISLNIYRELFHDLAPFRKYHVFNAKQLLRTLLLCLCTQIIHLSKQKMNQIRLHLYLLTVSNIIKGDKWRQQVNALQISRGNVTWDRGRINKNAIELAKKIFFHKQWENFQTFLQMRCIITGFSKLMFN